MKSNTYILKLCKILSNYGNSCRIGTLYLWTFINLKQIRMKTPNLSKLFFTSLCLGLFLLSGNIQAQSKSKLDVSVMKDCCMMTDGKMMQLKGGQLMPIKKPVILANGTKIKRNGKCILPDGKRIRMVEGNCMDNSGKLDNCAISDKPKNVTAR